MNKKIEVDVEILNFNTLKEKLLVIPDFQRSYVWKEKNLKKLIDDFKEFYHSGKDDYYMGAIILYEDDNKFEIIDGQQRITTLAILYSIKYRNIPENFKLSFSSQESINNIIIAKEFIEKNIDDLNIENIFNRLLFSVVITNSQDEAFTFFDTQNSRGVKLKAIDLLKAHHLRAISDNDKQRISAEKWEKIEKYDIKFLRKKDNFIDELFKYVLYRSRIWRGSNVQIEKNERIESEKIKEEFEKGSSSKNIQLYPHYKNMKNNNLDLKEEDFFYESNVNDNKNSIKDLPFSLRQPISKGLGFFLYVEKYAEIIHYLNSDVEELSEYRKFYKKVICNNSFSLYLRELFMLCIVVYYDKFEHNKIYEFSLRLEYLLGAIRLNQSMIMEKTIPKFLRELPYNIIDIIIGAYTPDEIMTFFKSINSLDKNLLVEIYKKNKTKKEDKEENTIQNRYINNILEYYQIDQSNNLNDKDKWINKRVNNAVSI